MRKKLIAANWKMYKTVEQAREFVAAFLPEARHHHRDEIVLCPAYVAISAVVEAVRGSAVGVGGQDMFWEKEGAYTGAVSAGMLRAAGCTHVIIGHSERRQYFGETDDTVNRKLRAALVNRKLKAALAAGLKPIVCVGEVLQEREAGLTDDILRLQCGIALRDISGAQAAGLVMAYEPVWAIGTGKTATPEMAAQAHEVLREEAAKALGDNTANHMRILYGGSVKPENAAALMSQPEIDGALVGGASLDPKSFLAIVRY
jgi:triosephosphate isomerase